MNDVGGSRKHSNQATHPLEEKDLPLSILRHLNLVSLPERDILPSNRPVKTVLRQITRKILQFSGLKNLLASLATNVYPTLIQKHNTSKLQSVDDGCELWEAFLCGTFVPVILTCGLLALLSGPVYCVPLTEKPDSCTC